MDDAYGLEEKEQKKEGAGTSRCIDYVSLSFSSCRDAIE